MWQRHKKIITPENQQRITVETTMKNLEADNGL